MFKHLSPSRFACTRLLRVRNVLLHMSPSRMVSIVTQAPVSCKEPSACTFACPETSQTKHSSLPSLSAKNVHAPAHVQAQLLHHNWQRYWAVTLCLFLRLWQALDACFKRRCTKGSNVPDCNSPPLVLAHHAENLYSASFFLLSFSLYFSLTFPTSISFILSSRSLSIIFVFSLAC